MDINKDHKKLIGRKMVFEKTILTGNLHFKIHLENQNKLPFN